MKFNYFNNTIEINATEAKAASKYDSETFKELQKMKAAEPTFTVKIVKATKKRDNHKGLTLQFIRSYVSANAKGGQMEVLEKLEKTSSFGEIRTWFLAEFREIEGIKERAEAREIVENAKKRRQEYLEKIRSGESEAAGAAS